MMGKMISLFNKYKEMILYIVFGGLTTLVNFIVFFSLDIFEINYLLRNAIAIIISIIFAYITNKIYVFITESNSIKSIVIEFLKFIGCRGFSALCDMFCMYIIISLMHLGEIFAKIATGIIVIILNYVFSKYFIFKKETVRGE